MLYLKEDKEAVVAAAQELERQKAALQARRQLEFQRQRTKSLEAAAQQKHQQEQEQQTLYRSKMESWANSRKQQLEGQLGRLRELTTGIRTRNMLLSKELSDLVSHVLYYIVCVFSLTHCSWSLLKHNTLRTIQYHITLNYKHAAQVDVISCDK